jgi:hypothetical protein
MSRRHRNRLEPTNPILKQSVGDVIGEAARAQRNVGLNMRGQPALSGDALADMLDDAHKGLAVDAWPAPPPRHEPEPVAAPEDTANWPMPVAEFRKQHFLHSGDVVLTTKLGSFFSFLNRKIDSSDFAHAALVFATPDADIGIDESYLIETTFSGVELAAFGEIVEPTKVYEDTGRPPEYIVGIKRLEHPWTTPALRAMVSGRMLRFLNVDDYDYSMLAALAARHTQFWFNLRSLLFGRAPSLAEYVRKRRSYAPAEFICSGFVQFAFVDMVREAVERGLVSGDIAEEAWRQVIFADWVGHDTTMEDLMGVRPIELARSDRLSWKYLVYGGEVHRISEAEQVDDLLAQIRKERKQRAARNA